MVSIVLHFEMESSLNSIEDSFQCEICENTFSTRRSKNIHARIVHGEQKNFTCTMCNKVFRRKNQLSLHLKNHNQEGPIKFKCDSCEKSFTQSGSLKTHMKTGVYSELIYFTWGFVTTRPHYYDTYVYHLFTFVTVQPSADTSFSVLME